MLGVPRFPTLQTGAAVGVGAPVVTLDDGDALALDVSEPVGAVSVDPHPEHKQTAITTTIRSAPSVRIRSPIVNVYRGSLSESILATSGDNRSLPDQPGAPRTRSHELGCVAV